MSTELTWVVMSYSYDLALFMFNGTDGVDYQKKQIDHAFVYSSTATDLHLFQAPL